MLNTYNDSIPDGKEIKGYTVKIITGWAKNGTPISEDKTIPADELDPLIPYGYNASDGFHWSDTDGDHIPDVVESMLNNASQFMEFYNFTHRDDWMKDYAKQLWDDYEWSMAYYYALKFHKSWDVVNGQLDAAPISHIKNWNAASGYNASCAENATKYLTTQYNALVVENMAPVIVKFTVNFHYYVVTAEVDVQAVVRDVGEVNSVVIKDSDFAQSVKWSGASKKVVLKHTFWASVWGANLGVNITVIGKDWRGNRAKISKCVEGPLGKTLKALWQLLPAWLRHGLQQLARAAVQAVNVIGSWLKSILLEAINKFIDSLKSLFSRVLNAYVEFVKALSEYIGSGTSSYAIEARPADSGNAAESVAEAGMKFIEAIMDLGIAIGVLFGILMTAMLIVKVVTGGVEEVVSSGLLDFAENTIIISLIPVVGGELIEKIVNTKGENEGSLMDKLLVAMGISMEGAEKIIDAISSAFDVLLLKKGKSASFSWKYIVKYAAIAIALTSFLWTYVSPAVRKWVPYAGVAISVAGLAIFIIDKLLSKNQPEEETERNVFPIVNLIEWILPFVGFANAVLEVMHNE